MPSQELQSNQLFQPETPERADKRVHVALPLRITYWDGETHPGLELACTYDISPRGARISRLQTVNQVGEIIAVERGRNKAFCRVVWIGEANSELKGQIGIQCVEADRLMWEAELRVLDEVYDPIFRKGEFQGAHPLDRSERNRRRRERFDIKGYAELLKAGRKPVRGKAQLRDLSEFGCLIAGGDILNPGANLKLDLKVGNYDLSFKGEVRHSEPEFGAGIEFREIRKGDRNTLQFLLRKLAEHELEQSFQFELA